ncbi:cytochrome P450 4C1-like isoform X1 [Planococcus citri]|uniref:cytochrome P450 4C1-like isoform X1 n=1 Tax=Planococcus citri TaxID=170843 RepID=UPI0031F86251
MLLILFASLIFVIIFIILIDKLKNKNFYKLMNQFHSYPTYPLIGNLNMLYGSLNDILENFEKIMIPNDRVFFWLGPYPVLLLKKYDDIATVLTQASHRDMLGFGEEWLGTGIVTAKYDEWKVSRRALQPAFSTEMLSSYVSIFEKNSSALVDRLKPAADSGKIIDVWGDVMKCNVDSIVEITLGVPMQGIEQKGKEFSDALIEASKSVAKQAITPWLQPRIIYNAYLRLTGKIKFIHQFHALPTQILQDKLKEYKNGENSSEHVDSSKVIIDRLIKASFSESSFTETRIRNEVTHVIFAAIETTGLNLCFSMVMLAIHQDIQQKVYQEIEELFKDNDTLTADHLFNGLKYMEQCIKETSRIFAHSTVGSRRTHKECILKDNTIIPANTMVAPLFFLANKDPDLYKNPKKWDPEHFSEEAVKNRPKNSFMSFGYGPRSCIGTRYAMLSIKTEMLYILREYHLSTNIKEFTKEHLYADLFVRSSIGYPIKFTRRKDLNDNQNF